MIKNTGNYTFESFFLAYFTRVKMFIYSLLKDEYEAEDLSQDIFLRLWEDEELLNKSLNNDAFLFTVVKNNVFNYIRHKKVEQAYQKEILNDAEQSVFSEILEQIEADELKMLLMLEIDNMPEQRRRIFRMSRFMKKSNQDIADELHLSIRTVERHLYLALKTIKKIIAFFIILIA